MGCTGSGASAVAPLVSQMGAGANWPSASGSTSTISHSGSGGSAADSSVAQAVASTEATDGTEAIISAAIAVDGHASAQASAISMADSSVPRAELTTPGLILQLQLTCN